MEPRAFATHTHRAITRDEWQAIHDRVAGVYKASEFVRETLLGVARLRRTMFASASGDVLDVGCGYGANFPFLSNATSITGVDFSPAMLHLAHQHIERAAIPIELRKGDAEALDFPEQYFDTVVSTFTTCSLLDPVAALREMKRVCKASGRILLLEHGRSDWRWVARYQDRTVAQSVEQSGCRWNQNPLNLVREAGLTITRSRRSHGGIAYLIEVSP